MRKKYLIMLIALACLFVATVFADEIDDLRDRQATVRNQGTTARAFMDGTTARKNGILADVAALDAQLDDATRDLSETEDALTTAKERLLQAQAALVETEDKRAEQYAAMKARIRYMYENGRIGYISALLNANSFADFVNRLEYITIIINYDNNMADNLAETQRLLTEQRNDAETERAAVLFAKEQQETTLAALEDVMFDKQALLLELTVDETLYREQIAELEREDLAIEELILSAERERAEREERERVERERLEQEAREQAEREERERQERERQARAAAAQQNAAAPSYFGGILSWPVYGYYNVSSGYGARESPVSGIDETHTGLDIPAPKGTPIHAAAAGTVILSGYNGGFGYCVIIDHGGGLATLYGHNSELFVNEGDYVTTGTVIAACGSTGISTGDHCHFEVRINGKHTDPRGYLN